VRASDSDSVWLAETESWACSLSPHKVYNVAIESCRGAPEGQGPREAERLVDEMRNRGLALDMFTYGNLVSFWFFLA
jgi:hypothetical protein